MRGTCPLLQSLLRVKRTRPVALHMSAFDPKRTSGVRDQVEQLARDVDELRTDLTLTSAVLKGEVTQLRSRSDANAA